MAVETIRADDDTSKLLRKVIRQMPNHTGERFIDHRIDVAGKTKSLIALSADQLIGAIVLPYGSRTSVAGVSREQNRPKR